MRKLVQIPVVLPIPLFLSDLTATMQSIATELKLDAEERMKIQITPWIESDVIKMEELYTRLTIEEHTNKVYGIKRESIADECETSVEYKKLFNEKSGTQKQRILVKGDPGIGKTTFLRKVAWDWATGNFKLYRLVFPIILKLVNSTDSIEEMILRQNPTVEGCRINKETLAAILEQHGDKCLLLLDGYDEMKENGAIGRLLEKRVYPKCNIVLTSRPNIVNKIQKHFTTVASVEGFSREKAREYIGKALDEKSKVENVMEYSESNEIVDMWRYPVLVMFLCLLVNEDYIDTDKERLSLEELYTRLLDFLYRRYTVRANIEYDQKNRDIAILKLGKIAFETLTQKKQDSHQSFITDKIGQEIFEYGILMANTDRRILEGRDVALDFHHKTIQEFLAAKYLVSEAQHGSNTVVGLLKGQGSEFIEENFIFFTLALDISASIPEDHSSWKFFSRNIPVLTQLENYIHSQLNKSQVTIKAISMSSKTCGTLTKLIARCDNLKHLKLMKVRFSEEFTVILSNIKSLKTLDLTQCSHETKAYLNNQDVWPKSFLTEIKIWNSPSADLITTLLKFNYCSLRILHMCGSDLMAENLESLELLNDKCFIPNISELRIDNNINISGSLQILFSTKWEQLETLHALECNLSNQDIEQALYNVSKCMPKCKEMKLFSHVPTQRYFQQFISSSSSSNLNNFPNSLEFNTNDIVIDDKIAVTDNKESEMLFAVLTKLNYFCFIKSLKVKSNNTVVIESLSMLNDSIMEGHLKEIQHIDINGLEGQSPSADCVQTLLNLDFPLLRTLRFSGCDFTEQNLKSLGSLNTKGFLPNVRQLHLDNNPKIANNLHILFGEIWEQLEIFHAHGCNLSKQDISCALQDASIYMPKCKDMKLFSNEVTQQHFVHFIRASNSANQTKFPDSLKFNTNNIVIDNLVITESTEVNTLFAALTESNHFCNITSLKVVKPNNAAVNNGLSMATEAIKKSHLQKVQHIDITGHEGQSPSPAIINRLLTFDFPLLEVLRFSVCDFTEQNLNSLGFLNEKGSLPNLREMYIDNNPKIAGNLSHLFNGAWKKIETLHAHNCNLLIEDVQCILQKAPSYMPECREVVLFTNDSVQNYFQQFISMKNKCSMHCDSKTIIIVEQRITMKQEMNVEGCPAFVILFGALASFGYYSKVQALEIIHGFNEQSIRALLTISSIRQIKIMDSTSSALDQIGKAHREGNLGALEEIKVSDTNLSGHLSTLFESESHKFMKLSRLILDNCKLTDDDLESLCSANKHGQIPALEYLGLPRNNELKIDTFLKFSTSWDNLKTLEWEAFRKWIQQSDNMEHKEKFPLITPKVGTSGYAKAADSSDGSGFVQEHNSNISNHNRKSANRDNSNISHRDRKPSDGNDRQSYHGILCAVAVGLGFGVFIGVALSRK